jgi:hypothetical protein
MTTSDVRDTTSTVALPRPRVAPDETATAEAAPRPEAPHYPWPEPWRFSRAARPRTEFWDVATASWRSRGPVSSADPTE